MQIEEALAQANAFRSHFDQLCSSVAPPPHSPFRGLVESDNYCREGGQGMRGRNAGICLLLALAACGRGPEAAENDAAALDKAANAVNAVASANDADNPDRYDSVIGLIGTEAQIGAANPNCTAFPPATGPHSVLGVRPGMTLPQATSTVRCQFPGIRPADARDVWAHSFSGIRHVTGRSRRSFSVMVPGSGRAPPQELNVYLAGLYNQERVFAIRTEVAYADGNQLPVETVLSSITQKYGPLVPEREDVYPIAVGLAAPNPFCLSLIGVAPLSLSNGRVNSLNVPWDRLGSCGTRLYVQLHQRDGLAERMQLMLVDFSILPGLHEQELAAAREAAEQARDAEVRRAQENAKDGGPRL